MCVGQFLQRGTAGLKGKLIYSLVDVAKLSFVGVRPGCIPTRMHGNIARPPLMENEIAANILLLQNKKQRSYLIKQNIS